MLHIQPYLSVLMDAFTYEPMMAALQHRQVMASWAQDLADFSEAKARLATSVRQAIIWLGRNGALSATPAQQQEVCSICV